MNQMHRNLAYLIPFLGGLSLALILPVAAAAQTASSTPAAQEVAAANDLPISPAERQRLVGTYLLSMPGSAGRSMPFRVFEEEGKLYGQPQGGQAMRLLYQGDNKFRPEKELDSSMTFTIQNEKAISFTVESPQGRLEGVRDGTAQP
jgi:hypothetical protein